MRIEPGRRAAAAAARPRAARRAGLAWLGSLTIAIGFVPGAAWAEPKWLLPGASFALRADDNVYRLGDQAAAALAAPNRRSDVIAIGTARLGLALQPGRQQLRLDASLDDVRYRHNRHLDHHASDVAASWQWDAPDHWSASAAVGARRALAPFNAPGAGVVLTAADLVETRYANATVRRGVFAGYAVRLAADTLDVRHSEAARQQLDYASDTVGIDVERDFRAQLALGVGTRLGTMRWPGSSGGASSRRQDIDLRLRWRDGARHVVDARLSRTRQRPQNASGAQVESWTGAFGWRWLPAARTTLSLNLVRDTARQASSTLDGPISVGIDADRFVDGGALRLDYAQSARLGWWATAIQARDVLDQRITWTGFGTAGTGTRSTRTRLQAGMRWTIGRSGALACDLGTERLEVDPAAERVRRARTGGCAVSWQWPA